jgi:hypothetical protein
MTARRRIVDVLCVALALLFAEPLARARSGEPLASAQRHMRELRYESARSEVERSIRRGHHTRKELVALYALRAELASIMDGPSVGESAFRRVLVLAPDHTPSRATPIFAGPFAAAQRWVTAHGRLAVEHTVATPRPGSNTPVAITVASDPFAMVSGARVRHRVLGEDAWVAVPGLSMRPWLPPIPPGTVLEYYIEVVDASDNVLVQLGTAEAPMSVEAPGPTPPAPSPSPAASKPIAPANVPPALTPPPVADPPAPAAASLVAARPPRPVPRGYLISGGVLTAVGLGALAAAIGVDVSGRQTYDNLTMTCAPSCSPSAVDGLRVSEAAAIGLYVTAGATLTTSLILFSIDLARTHRRR